MFRWGGGLPAHLRRPLQMERRVSPEWRAARGMFQEVDSLAVSRLTHVAPHSRGGLSAGLAGMAVEKAEGLLVELAHVLVDGGMRAGLEHDDLTVFDAVLHYIGEARRSRDVVAAESYLGRRPYVGKLGHGVMSNYRIRLTYEGLEWLLRPTAYESGELVNIVWLRSM